VSDLLSGSVRDEALREIGVTGLESRSSGQT
jgi:hypothetical protein